MHNGCAWRASQLGEMLREHAAKDAGKKKVTYNEVVLDVHALVRTYPGGIEAFTYSESGGCGRDTSSHSQSKMQHRAHDAARDFRAVYGVAVPVLALDIDSSTPFQADVEVDP